MNYFESRICLLIPFIAIISVSCKKDFLETPPNTSAVRQQYISDLATCNDYLNGIYIDLSAQFCHGFNSIYGDLVSDNIKPIGTSSTLFSQYSWTQLANEMSETNPGYEDVNMNALWAAGYRIVRNCSYVLENIDKYRSEDSIKADYLKGQAYALRAFVHHQLVNTFAQPYRFTADALHPGIPYVTTSDYTRKGKRNTVKEVYASIISDLNTAIPLLENYSASKIFMTSGAAKAILARVYFFKEDYDNAKRIAREVIGRFPIMTTSYPADLFTDRDSESLFQLPPASSGVNNSLYFTYYAGYWVASSNNYFVATEDIAALLNENENDRRRKWLTLSIDGWRIKKFPSQVVDGILFPHASYYHTIIRSSELYLMAAEAYARIGNEDSAYYFLDEVKRRADSAAAPSSASGNELIEQICKERRKEFAFEGIRMFDLLRRGKGVERIDAASSAAKFLPYPSNKAVAPIPQLDVSLSGFTQNPGY